MMPSLRYVCLLVCLALAACANAPVAGSSGVPENVHGAFIGFAPVLESQLAEETVRHLARVYPPDENLLDFQQEIAIGDGFGQKLLLAARNMGYFVRLSHLPGTPSRCGGQSGDRESDVIRSVPVCYLVDEVDGWLRLTLHTAGDVWSRLFAGRQDGGLRPAGAWTHRQGE
jgi:hypothetical protein